MLSGSLLGLCPAPLLGLGALPVPPLEGYMLLLQSCILLLVFRKFSGFSNPHAFIALFLEVNIKVPDSGLV